MRKEKNNRAFTLVELMVAAAMLVIIMAAIVPQFRAIRSSWAKTEESSNIVQNKMVLSEHLNRNLSTATKIIAVSSSSETSGFITFKDNLGATKKYIVSGGYVAFGDPGSEALLAGPVSKFKISCFSLENFDTPITDANNIRYVEIESDLTNKTVTTSIYLQTNASYSCGLTGYWKLDETSGTTAADSSGSGNNGTLINGPTWTTGQVGGAVNLDGSNDYINCGNGQSLNITGDISIAFWLYANSFANEPDFVTKGLYTESYAIWAIYSGIIRFGINNDRLSSNSAIPIGQWYHIAATRSGSTRKLYINGQLDASDTYSAAIGTTSRALTITSTGYPLNGKIDDVRIYDRALSDTEVRQLANTLIYGGFNEARTALDTTTLAIPIPASTSNGDLLIAAVATDGDSSASIAAPAGQGWTLIDRGNFNSAVTLGVWQKIAGSSEPASHTFTWTGNRSAYGWIMRFTGHDSDNPINAFSTAGLSSATPASPPVTTTTNDCIILRLGAFNSGDITVDDPGLHSPIDHTAITMDSSGSSNVTLLGSWLTSGAPHTHAKATGNNRALVFTAHARRNGSTSLTSVTYGGQPMTKIVEAIHGTGNPRICTTAFILNDAGIDAATTTTFTPTWSSAPSSVAYSSVFLQNTNQATPTGTFADKTTTSGATISTDAPLANSAGNMVIEAATGNAANTFTANNGFTKFLPELTISSADGMVGYKSATGVNETPSVTHSAARKSLVGFVVKGAGMVSGGAGYVKQSASGSSGTSTFTLSSANEARMVTIAIAPVSSIDCDSQIKP